ncbi:MAG: hypothetical protein KAS32_29565 [Candidatus Peribacteraceae bacterium]|nr:hypothetical protein [Candidatus Peribacteraceae bacterium]
MSNKWTTYVTDATRMVEFEKIALNEKTAFSAIYRNQTTRQLDRELRLNMKKLPDEEIAQMWSKSEGAGYPTEDCKLSLPYFIYYAGMAGFFVGIPEDEIDNRITGHIKGTITAGFLERYEDGEKSIIFPTKKIAEWGRSQN